MTEEGGALTTRAANGSHRGNRRTFVSTTSSIRTFPTPFPTGCTMSERMRDWSVGCDLETATSAMERIRRRWRAWENRSIQEGHKLLICADSGGRTDIGFVSGRHQAKSRWMCRISMKLPAAARYYRTQFRRLLGSRGEPRSLFPQKSAEFRDPVPTGTARSSPA